MSPSPSPSVADSVAKSVLKERLRVRPRENVTIECYPTALPWAAGFVREARRLGARPYVRYEDEASYWTAVDEGAARLVGTMGEHEEAQLAATDVYIYFWGPEDMRRRQRLSARDSSAVVGFNSRWYDIARKESIRGARMGLARVTERNARAFGVAYSTWYREMVAATLRPVGAAAKQLARVRRILERGTEVRIRHPNGTDLRLALANRPFQESLGRVTAESRRTRFGMMANVPEAIAYTTVDERTAEGVLVANRATRFGLESREGGRWRFRDGHLVSASYRVGGSGFRRDFGRGGLGKDTPSLLEIGLDPHLRHCPMLEESEAGAVSVAVGGNTAWGGRTKGGYAEWLTLGDAELRIDGRPLVRGGRVRA